MLELEAQAQSAAVIQSASEVVTLEQLQRYSLRLPKLASA